MRKSVIIIILLATYSLLAKGFVSYSYWEKHLADYCIARYKLNENAANSDVADEGGTHNGTFTSEAGEVNTADYFSTGKVGRCCDCGSGDRWIEIDDHNDFTPALTPFSISAWAKIDIVTGFTFASKIGALENHEWRFAVMKADKLCFDICDIDAGEPYAMIRGKYSGDLSSYLNVWTHFVATYNGGVSGDNIHLYINGNQVDDIHETEDGFVSCKNSDQVVRIGRKEESLSSGKIDAVYIFDKELTPPEVNYLYNSGKGIEK